ncbi:MFS transporter [Methanofollis aquaemaris]|uniref:MFS transporter n=1 Tax=Methanofollis aquaemaris TaxID=126734 RepID=A0A8A3S440_9EURY|nr:MFS transporter [Methanofollis aquaemaris]
MAGLGVISPLMPYYAGALDASGLVLGLIFAAFPLARGIFSPYAGALSDREGRRWFVVAGLLGFAVVSALYPFAVTAPELFLVRFLHGAAAAVVITVAMASMAEAAPPGREGTAMGIFHAAIYLGMATGPFIGGVISEYAGVQGAFTVMALVAGAAGFLAIALPPGTVRPPPPASEHSFCAIAADPGMRGLLVFRAVHALGRGGILAFVPIFASTLAIGPKGIGILLFVHIFAIAVLQIPSGERADHGNKRGLVFAGSVVSSVALLLIPFSGDFVTLLLACSLTSLGTALSMSAAAAMAVQRGRVWGVGASLGVFNTAFSVGMIISPLLSGVVMDVAGVFGVFWAAGALGLLGSLYFWVMSREAVPPRRSRVPSVSPGPEPRAGPSRGPGNILRARARVSRPSRLVRRR